MSWKVHTIDAGNTARPLPSLRSKLGTYAKYIRLEKFNHTGWGTGTDPPPYPPTVVKGSVSVYFIWTQALRQDLFRKILVL